MAEEVRFELTEDFSSLVFKTRALSHSATLPLVTRDGFEPSTIRL